MARIEELAAYRLKEMQFAWFTPSLEKMLLHHHSERAGYHRPPAYSFYHGELSGLNVLAAWGSMWPRR